MKKKKFKKATSPDGLVYINHVKNTVIMKFKPTLWEKIKILFGTPIWGGTPYNRSRLVDPKKNMDIQVTRTAFLKEDGD